MIMHVDANSFYASCERLFRPDLQQSPIVVLSNNDGIIIALNKEAKSLGFSRGDVFFKVREACEQKKVSVFSSNYTLYADISARIVSIYHRFSPDIEVYSIDESFLYFPKMEPAILKETGRAIRRAVLKEIGIPVSVGIAPTKTLSKLCNKLAKRNPDGICFFSDLNEEAELADYPAKDIWGIGWSKAALLSKKGVKSALDLKRYPLAQAKKDLSITGMRLVQELNGVPAIDRIIRTKRQNICSSRSFGKAASSLEQLETALTEYTHEAVRRMREEGSAARFISVALMTNPWSDTGEQYCNQISAELPMPSSYLGDILKVALAILKKIYKPGYRYRKVMINLLDLSEDRMNQLSLFERDEYRERNQALMLCFDSLNRRYGRTSLFMGKKICQDNQNTEEGPLWKMRRDFLSPDYTTSLSSLPRVY